MGPKPSPKHTVERVNNHGPYDPENCVWATHITQARNTRRNILMTYQGTTRPIREWVEITGLTYSCLQTRRARGWSDAETLGFIPHRSSRSL
jgi:hypothetical protein